LAQNPQLGVSVFPTGWRAFSVPKNEENKAAGIIADIRMNFY
jgi:hypothetical protein